MSDDRPPPLTIRRVRITGLAGPAPSADQVRHAVATAFARDHAPPAARTQAPLRHDATLADAAMAAARAARGRVR
jgi:hypothetical protein